MKVYYHTFGCKANQYDTERFRQELEARGSETVDSDARADVCVVNSCTVTNQADAQARRLVRRLRRDNPGVRVVVAGCSAALREEEYRAMPGVAAVVPGHDPVAVSFATVPVGSPASAGPDGTPPPPAPGGDLVQLELRAPLDRVDTEPVGAELLRRRSGATRGWLKIQDGCDRKCSFCATRLARGKSRSRPAREVVAEARLMARSHPELVLTGIHIGHYGRDLAPAEPVRTLSRLLATLLDAVPDVRFRLGSVEATEVDDLLLELLVTSGGRVAPHLHMPLQSGADPVLRTMRRWHTREDYRSRALEIAERMTVLGLGADVITGFPGERDEDHRATVELVEELPFTYLHVFPFSPRDGTAAADRVRTDPVPQRVAGERSRELRDRVREKAEGYRVARAGGRATVTLERGGSVALTGDYLRVPVCAAPGGAPVRTPGDRPSAGDPLRTGGTRPTLATLHTGYLRADGGDLYIDLSRSFPQP